MKVSLPQMVSHNDEETQEEQSMIGIVLFGTHPFYFPSTQVIVQSTLTYYHGNL